MTRSPWSMFRTTQCYLFHIINGKPKYLEFVNVINIQFCPNHLLHIQGALPDRRDLLEMQDGAEFIITQSECGPAGVFENGTPVFGFKNCKIKNSYMMNSISMNEDDLLFVDVVFECDISIPEWGPQ